MSVEANVVTREKQGALLVPADAVQGSRVFVVEGDRVRRRQVEIGIRGTRSVEVVSACATERSPRPRAFGRHACASRPAGRHEPGPEIA
jgi:hypothetical protein